MSSVRGQIRTGTSSFYHVEVGSEVVRCRIRGKTLPNAERTHAPLAVGDYVEIEADAYSSSEGWIVKRLERSTQIDRWNRKHRAMQVLAANVEMVACITSGSSPPFRPRFIDRLLVAGEHAGVPSIIILNKTDLGVARKTADRIADYRRSGYRVVACSAATGAGVKKARRAIGKSVTLLCGQSGVGKSSLLNAWDPGLHLRTRAISRKYDRGAHTTIRSELLTLRDGGRLIDSPGIRELELGAIEARDIRFRFRDFQPWLDLCEYPACLCDGEPGCAVRSAVEAGEIHPDRYESYLRLLREVQERDRTRAHA